MQWHVDVTHHLMNKYYMAKMSNLDQILLLVNPSRTELDRIKQHAQWPHDKKKMSKPGYPSPERSHVPHRSD